MYDNDNDDNGKNVIAVIVPTPVPTHNVLHDSTKQALRKLKNSMELSETYRESQITNIQQLQIEEQNNLDILSKKK